MGSPKTIQLFLMDGTPRGRLKATLRNWTGVTYLLPRSDLDSTKEREDLKQSGVYLLFGRDDDGVDKVYVGQAGVRKNGAGVLGRISEHVGEERLGYWTHAVALITTDDSFGPTEISYLENRFHQLAIEANRFEVTNNNQPSAGNVTEEKQAELDEFVSYARLVIGAIGYRVFEPVDEAKGAESGRAAEPTLIMTDAGVRALGRQTSDGFVLLAGSRLRPDSEFASYTADSVRRAREKHAAKIGPDWVLSEDLLFSSPSGAAVFVVGGTRNGLTSWKNESGVTLKDLERQGMS